MNRGKRGRFRITSSFLEDASIEDLDLIFKGMVVIKAEHLWADDRMEYTACCEEFPEVDPGGATPFYVVSVVEGSRVITE